MGVTVGIDIGGTKIGGGVVDDSGQVREETKAETPAANAADIADAVVAMVRDLATRHTVEAVGVGAAGFVDADRSTVLFAPNLAWRDEPLRERVESRVGVPVVVENDANAAAWGEFRYGGGHDVDDMVLLTVGTGLGGGIVLDGELVRGAHGVGGEVGHLRVVPDGHRCGCGNKGCWEQYASGSALVREARSLARSGSPQAARIVELAGGDPEEVDGEHVTQAADDGDAAARELLEDLGRWLGEGIATLAAVLDPAAVVVGGGVASAGDLLLEPARQAFARQLTGRGHRPVLEIRPATLGNQAGIVGAADLARRR